MDSFFDPGEASEIYELVREKPLLQDTKDNIEKMWSMYEQYADPGFKDQAKTDFNARIWEMYVTCTFLERGLNVQPKTSSDGPDCKILIGEKVVWVEATTATEGEDANAIKRPKQGVAGPVPRDEIILRITNSFAEKFKGYEAYLESGIVGENDPYFIAINSAAAHPIRGDILPFSVAAMYGFENYNLQFNVETGEQTGNFWTYRADVKNANDAKVQVSYFVDPKYAGVTGIITSSKSVLDTQVRKGDELDFVFNKNAKNNVARDAFPLGKQWWPEETGLVFKEW